MTCTDTCQLSAKYVIPAPNMFYIRMQRARFKNMNKKRVQLFVITKYMLQVYTAHSMVGINQRARTLRPGNQSGWLIEVWISKVPLYWFMGFLLMIVGLQSCMKVIVITMDKVSRWSLLYDDVVIGWSLHAMADGWSLLAVDISCSQTPRLWKSSVRVPLPCPSLQIMSPSSLHAHTLSLRGHAHFPVA